MPTLKSSGWPWRPQRVRDEEPTYEQLLAKNEAVRNGSKRISFADAIAAEVAAEHASASGATALDVPTVPRSSLMLSPRTQEQLGRAPPQRSLLPPSAAAQRRVMAPRVGSRELCLPRISFEGGDGVSPRDSTDSAQVAAGRAHRSAKPAPPGKAWQRRFVDYYKEHLTIDPRSCLWLHGWELVSFVVTLAVAFLAPYEAAFVPDLPVAFEVTDHFVYCFFLVDVVLQCFVALPDPDRPSCVLRSPRDIIGKYVMGWMLVDLLAVSPYLAVLTLRANGARQFRGWRVDSIVRYMGLCRLLRVPRLVDRGELLRRWQIFFGFSFAALEVLKYLTVVAMALHWMACVWGGVGLKSSEEHTWLRKLAADKGFAFSLYQDSPCQVYSVCLYWAIMTLTSVGYGDICPQNMREYWVACLCMAMSAALWTFIIGEVCRIAASVDPHNTRFMQTMDDLNSLMRARSVPRAMRMSMRTYLYEARDVDRLRAQTPVIQQMSPMLQGQIAMQLHQAWLEKVWYLREIEGQALVNIARRLLADFFAPNEEVASNRTLFILRRGICVRRSKVLLKGDIWGEDMVLSNEVLRDEAPVKAISYLEVLMLHNLDLFQAVKAFPEVLAQIHKVKVRIAVMRGFLLVARAIKDLMYREEWDRSDITEETEQYLVQTVLAGGAGQIPRRSASPPKKKPTRTSREPCDDRCGAEVPGEGGQSQAIAPIDQPMNEIQALTLAIANLTMKVDNLQGERRSSRVERY